MALQENAPALASAVVGGGIALKLVEIAWDALKGRRDRQTQLEEREDDRAAKDAELLHKTETEFRSAILLRLQQVERNDAEKSGRIRDLEGENGHLRASMRKLEEENGQLRARVQQLEATHGAD